MTKRFVTIIILICSQLIIGVPKSSAEEKNTPEIIHWDISKIQRVGTITPIISSHDTVWDFILDDFDNDFQQEIGILRSDDNNPFFLFVREIDTYSLTFNPGTPLMNYMDANHLRELKGNDQYKCLSYRVEENKGFVDLFNYKLKPVQSLQTICGKDKNASGSWDGNLLDAEVQI